MVQTEADPT